MEVRQKSEKLFAEADVAFAGVFGSLARGTAKNDSDVDIVVRFKNPKTLLDFFALQDALEVALHRKVDLVTERAIDERMRDAIRQELQPLYGER